MPPDQTPPPPLPQPEPFNFWETDPKKNFAPWFLKFCLVLIIIGLAIAGYFKYQAYKAYQAGLVQEIKTDQNSLYLNLPPDPGEAGKLTLQGIDSDNDGVRDDVQRLIILNYPESAQVREVLRHSAIATQKSIINNEADEETRRAILDDELASVRCLTYIRDATFSYQASIALNNQLINTEARRNAYEKYSNSLKASWYDSPQLSELKNYCDPSILTADWQTYRNEEYGFEFRYPQDLTIESVKNLPRQFRIYDPNYIVPTRALGQELRTESRQINIVIKDNLNASSIPLTTSAPSLVGPIFRDAIPNDKYIFEIETVAAHESLARQILSTFKFTN